MCQQAKHGNCKLVGLLKLHRIPKGAWQENSMDFIEGLPKSVGYDVILVIVYGYTKYAHFIPLEHAYSTHSVEKAVFNNVVKLHSIPMSIVSDRILSSQVIFGKICLLCSIQKFR
jgi:hypothetical protein